MKRRYLFEFNEAAWLPTVLRASITDYLRGVIELIQPFSPQLPLIARALRHMPADAGVVDLCSGSGGPWRHLSPQLNRLSRRRVPVVLTDQFPNPEAAASMLDQTEISYCPEPVDARAVPDDLAGLRSLFDGFHQFRRADAVAILADAVDRNRPIVIMELLARRPWHLPALLFTPILVWLLTPFMRPISWQRLTLTYLIPVAPLLITWDGLVSTLRCFTPAELLALAEDAGGTHYQWVADEYRHWGAPVTFLIGFPWQPAPDEPRP